MNIADLYEVMTANGKRPFHTPGVQFKNGAPIREIPKGSDASHLIDKFHLYGRIRRGIKEAFERQAKEEEAKQQIKQTRREAHKLLTGS